MTSPAATTRLAALKRARPDASPPSSPPIVKQPRVTLLTTRNDSSNTSLATVHPAAPEASSDARSATALLLLLQNATPTAASLFSYRLPSTQSLATSEQYLNEQLVHIASAAALERTTVLRRLGLASSANSANSLELDEAHENAVCQLDLVANVWAFVDRQCAYTAAGKEKLAREKSEAEQSLRRTMDLLSLLLFLRDQELVRQSELSEHVRTLETDLQRQRHQVHTLALELDATQQRLAQHTGLLRAKELAFATERKVAQTEKRSLEVLVARLQGVETAFKAQLRRKDAEYERLRKNLQDAVTRVSKDQRVRSERALYE